MKPSGWVRETALPSVLPPADLSLCASSSRPSCCRAFPPGADPRIGAASIAAPGFAFAFTKASLATVTAKVQLWSGELDTSVPTQTNAALLAKRLPTKLATHWVEKANHFAFMVVACREAFKQDDPEEYEVVCGNAEGFDRIAFHDSMHLEMLRFFDQSFGM